MELSTIEQHPWAKMYPTRLPVWWCRTGDSKSHPDLDGVTGKPVNMVDAGIIDPVLVTKSALKNAVSVVSTIISADCVISNIRINESN